MKLVRTVRYALAFMVAGGLLLPAGCGGGGEDKNALDMNSFCVPAADGTLRGLGPAGGEIVYSEPGHPSDGLTVRVAPGVLDQCWEVQLMRHPAYSNMSYPAGFLPFEDPKASGYMIVLFYGYAVGGGMLEPPASVPMEILFPLHSIEQGDSEVLAGFTWDDVTEDWRVSPPDSIDEQFLAIQISDVFTRFSWGRIDLGTVDFDKYLAPVVEAHHGAETWVQLDQQVDQIIAELGPLRFDCITLRALRNYFSELEPKSYAAVQAIQSGIRCGVCDATTPEFYSELNKFVNLHFSTMMMDLVFGSSRVFLLQVYSLSYAMYANYMLLSLECDFECFSRNVDATFYLQLSANYISRAVVATIDELLAHEVITCNMD
jgi:hypothetical protein